MNYYDSRSTNGVLCTVLEQCIKDILSFIKPLESDRMKRLNVIDEITRSIQSIGALKDASVRPFGSFVSNLYSKWGDLDISITLDQHLNSSASRRKKQNVLQEIMKTLRKNGVGRRLQFIPQARVPLLVYESSLYGISCDLSVNNHQGRVKSKVLKLVTSFDERFMDMVLLIKEWAKAQNINDPKTGTLNSFSLCLLVIFHLQTCKPPILPPLKEIYSGNICDDVEGVDTEREKGIEDICVMNVQNIISHISGHRNQSSLTDLLVSFFDKFSEIETLSSEYAICTFTGRWEKLATNPRWTEKSYSLYIEDPFEQPDNAARAVGQHDLSTIGAVFQMTRQLLSSSSILSDRRSLLQLLSRPLVSSQLCAPTNKHLQANLHQYPNINGKQQGHEHSVGHRVPAFAESNLNQRSTTRTRTTGKGYADPKHSSQLTSDSKLSRKSNQSKKIVDFVPSFRVAENHVHNPYQNRNNPSQSNLGKKSVDYCVSSSQVTEDPRDFNLTDSHRNRKLLSSAQRLDRASQDFTVNLNESYRKGSTIVEPKLDNIARNLRNKQIRLAGQTPERFDLGHNSGPHGVYTKGMTSGKPINDPTLIRNPQSHPVFGYSTTPSSSTNRNYDASMKGMTGMHRRGFASVEPITEQLYHGLKLNGQSHGNVPKKDKQVWQPKVASKQTFL